MTKKSTTNEVAKTGDDGLPAWLNEYDGASGLDQIGSEDVSIPRIKLGQGTSAEVKDKDLDVELGDFFLNVDGTVLAKAGEGLKFHVIAYTTEYILWRDRKDGGGIFARAPRRGAPGSYEHAWNKPNETFENKIGGQIKVEWTTGRTVETDGLGDWGSEIPGNDDSGIAATKHHNYVVYLPDHEMVAALSLQRGGAKAARGFNASLKMGGRPIFAHEITLTSIDEHSNDGEEYKGYRFKKGPVTQDADLASNLAALFKQFNETSFTVDQSDEAEQQADEGTDDCPF